jgi:hypothetical protein
MWLEDFIGGGFAGIVVKRMRSGDAYNKKHGTCEQ